MPGLLQAGGKVYTYLLPIRNILVPQLGQTPWLAGTTIISSFDVNIPKYNGIVFKKKALKVCFG